MLNINVNSTEKYVLTSSMNYVSKMIKCNVKMLKC